jgi:ribulose-5-phosphate 4-epimerase/fuculose-1-phosphate aldolase
MSAVSTLQQTNPAGCSPEEWEARVDLACCYRAVEHMGWHKDSIYNHVSLKVPGTEKHFLINPFGLLYQEITASNLLKIDLDANKIVPSPHPVYAPGFVVHSPVHRARPELHCIIHTHSPAGMAVACQKQGLLPTSLSSLLILPHVAYYDLDGLVDDPKKSEGIAHALGDKNALIMRNHGLLACGRTVGEAFALMRRLETACEVQVLAQSGGAELQFPPDHIMAQIHARQSTSVHKPRMMGADSEAKPRDYVWEAMRRLMERVDPSFMH